MGNQSDISDAMILDKIKNDHLAGWEALYDNYSIAMLSMICKLSVEKTKGEEILTLLFTGNEFKNFIGAIQSKLSFQLCRFAFCYAAKELQSQGIQPAEETLNKLPLLLKLLYEKTMEQNRRASFNSTNHDYRPVLAYSWVPILETGISA